MNQTQWGTVDSTRLPGWWLLVRARAHSAREWVNTQPASLSLKWCTFCFGQGGFMQEPYCYHILQRTAMTGKESPRHLQICPNCTYCPLSCLWPGMSKGCWMWCAQHRTNRKWSAAKLGMHPSLEVTNIILYINTLTLPLHAAIAINKTTLEVLFLSY